MIIIALKVEQKDLFVDLRSNKGGIYLKISERTGNVKNTILFPSSGVKKLRDALTEVLEHVPEDRKLSRLRRERGLDEDLHERSVFISGLAWTTDEDKLKKHMSTCGDVIQCSILRRGKKKSMGCGVVEFTTRDFAQNAIHTMNNTELEGRTLHCREDRRVDGLGNVIDHGSPIDGGSGDEIKYNHYSNNNFNGTYRNNNNPNYNHNMSTRKLDEKKIFVHNLSQATTSNMLLSYFSVIGEITRAEVTYNHAGISIRSGYVEFSSSESVQAAISQLNNQVLDGNTIKIKECYGRG